MNGSDFPHNMLKRQKRLLCCRDLASGGSRFKGMGCRTLNAAHETKYPPPPPPTPPPPARIPAKLGECWNALVWDAVTPPVPQVMARGLKAG